MVLQTGPSCDVEHQSLRPIAAHDDVKHFREEQGPKPAGFFEVFPHSAGSLA